MRATDDASTSAGLPKVLVIAGPTAVGKTSLSLRMASALNGEIVSADSVQVFEGLDVGASKLPVNERNGILRVRGLPFHCSFSDIYAFFAKYKLLQNGIYRAYDFNRPSGECYVVFQSQQNA